MDVTVIKTGCSLTGALMRAFVAAFLHEGAVASQRPVGHAVLPQQVALTVGFGGEEGVAARTREWLLTWVKTKREPGFHGVRHWGGAQHQFRVCVSWSLPVCVSMCLCSELAHGNTRGQKGQVSFWTELE